jgi:hypothetical protein
LVYCILLSLFYYLVLGNLNFGVKTDLQQEEIHSTSCFYYPLACIEPSFDLVHNLYFYPLILKTKEETKNVLTEIKVIKIDDSSRAGLPVCFCLFLF